MTSSYDRSNLAPLENSRSGISDRVKTLTDTLRADYQQSLRGNVLYRNYKFSKLFWAIVWLAAACWILYRREACELGASLLEELLVQFFQLQSGVYSAPILMIFRAGLVLFAISRVVTVLRFFYSKRVEGGGRRLNAVEQTIKKRLEEMNGSGFANDVQRAASNNDASFKAATANDLGERLGELHREFAASTQKAKKIKKIFGSVFSALYFLFGFFVIWQQREHLTDLTAVTLLQTTFFAAYTYFAIDFVLCSIGEYLGKFMRPFGCVLVLIYGIFVYVLTGDAFSATPVVTGTSRGMLPLTVGQITLGLQMIAMIAGVLTADYLGMRQKWESGFRLTMSYGDNKFKTKGSVIRRMLWTVPWIAAAWAAGCYLKQYAMMAVFPLVWWRAMPLMKPFGSTIYSFFGRAKCICFSLMCFGLFVPYFVLVNHVITMQTLMYWGICLGIYLVLGAIVKNRNDNTMFFEFMHHFI